MKPTLGQLNAGLTVCGALACIALAASPGLSLAGIPRTTLFWVFAGTTTQGALLGLGMVLRAATENKRDMAGVLSIVAAICGGVGAVMAVLLAAEQYSHGRPFRRRGRNRTARIEGCERWLEEPSLVPGVPAELREELAAEWRRNGAKEHASIAAFGRLSLDLVALGAPPRLLAEIQGDLLDEVRHARTCFSIARDLDGRAEGPGAFPEAAQGARLLPSRTLALGTLAVAAVIDGALNEGVSARILARLSQTSAPPRFAEALRGMAADEARHAAHSWNIVAFCIDVGGREIVHVLRGALRALPVTMTAELPEPARGGAWEAFGVQGEALEREAWATTRRHAVAKLTAMLDRHDELARTAA